MERKAQIFSFCKNKCHNSCQLPGGCGEYERFVRQGENAREIIEERANAIIAEGVEEKAVIFQRITDGFGLPNTHWSGQTEDHIKEGRWRRKRPGRS